MANVSESASFEAGIYRIETTDPVGGGENGIDNLPHKQLANRTQYLKKIADEVVAARGSSASLDERLDEFEPLDSDTQNALLAAITAAMSLGGLANREVEKSRTKRKQTGLVAIQNRGIINGCSVSKSSTATRNLSLAAGSMFSGGQVSPIFALDNGAIVPPNNDVVAKTCYAYLYVDSNGVIQFSTTNLGEAVPANGIPLYLITVPANNTDANDPYISLVTLTDVRRLEPNFPVFFSSAPYANVVLPFPVTDADYAISLDLVSIIGSGFQRGDIYPGDRNVNGFKIYYNGVADSLSVRWEISKPSL